MRIPTTFWIALLPFAATSCGGADVDVRYAPTFHPGPTSVAILGVFSDGHLSQEGWAILGATVSSAFGQRMCDVGFGTQLGRVDPDLYASVDEHVKANGITDEMLERMAAKTDAELVLTLAVRGQPVTGGEPKAEPSTRGRRMPGRTASTPSGRTVVRGGLELSASLYSVRLRRSVGRLSVRSFGTIVGEAVAALGETLRKELAGSTCRPWALAPTGNMEGLDPSGP